MKAVSRFMWLILPLMGLVLANHCRRESQIMIPLGETESSCGGAACHKNTFLGGAYSDNNPRGVSAHENHVSEVACNDCHYQYGNHPDHMNGRFEQETITNFPEPVQFNVAEKTCRAVSCHGNERIQLSWYEKANCMACHGFEIMSPRDGSIRRAVVEPFPAARDHGNLADDDNTCLVCHGQSVHREGTITLRDPDGGSEIRFQNRQSLAGSTTLTDFCFSCHDDDGAMIRQNPIDPFADGSDSIDIFSSLGSMVHKEPNQSCDDCHDSHGGENYLYIQTNVNGVSNIAVSGGTTLVNLCGSCHGGTVNGWHSSCTPCHTGHAPEVWPGPPTASSNCRSCHKHGTPWTHVDDCTNCHSEFELGVYGFSGPFNGWTYTNMF